MNVGIVYVAGVFFDGRRYTTDAYQHHQFAPIARRLGHIDLVTFLRNTPERTGRETLCVQNMTVLGLPFCEDGWQLYVTRTIRWVPALIRTLWRHRKAWDAVILYDLLLPNQIAYLACRILGIPVVLMVQGHVAEGMRQAHRDDRGPKRWLGRVYARWLAVSQRLLVRRTPTIADFIPSGASSVNGQPGRFMLYSGAIVSGSEVESSLMERTGDPVLLMVARVCPIKGVEFAIEATALLRERGMPVTLRVVGPLYGDAYGGYQYRLEGLI